MQSARKFSIEANSEGERKRIVFVSLPVVFGTVSLYNYVEKRSIGTRETKGRINARERWFFPTVYLPHSRHWNWEKNADRMTRRVYCLTIQETFGTSHQRRLKIYKTKPRDRQDRCAIKSKKTFEIKKRISKKFDTQFRGRCRTTRPSDHSLHSRPGHCLRALRTCNSSSSIRRSSSTSASNGRDSHRNVRRDTTPRWRPATNVSSARSACLRPGEREPQLHTSLKNKPDDWCPPAVSERLTNALVRRLEQFG